MLGSSPEDGLDPLMAGGALPGGVGPAYAAQWMSYDYRPLADSPAIDAGTPIGAPSTDIVGVPRDAKPDIGAYELGVPIFSIGKDGPLEVLPGEPITYTLTVTNSSDLAPATGVVITDALPTGAHYVSGGTLMPGDVVSWTVASLAGNDDVQVQFVVTATDTITNSDYRVSCAEGVSAVGTVPVVTNVRWHTVYLPLMRRDH